MEKLLLLGAGAAVVMLTPPVRRRAVAVVKALGGAGTGVIGATFDGVKGVASAMVKGPAETPAAA